MAHDLNFDNIFFSYFTSRGVAFGTVHSLGELRFIFESDVLAIELTFCVFTYKIPYADNV